jgi:hypothetical protein
MHPGPSALLPRKGTKASPGRSRDSQSACERSRNDRAQLGTILCDRETAAGTEQAVGPRRCVGERGATSRSHDSGQIGAALPSLPAVPAWEAPDSDRSIRAPRLSSVNHLWRIGLDGRTLPERIAAAGFARLLATTMASDRLTFTEWRFALDIYRFEPSGASQPLLTSSFLDWNPHSPRTATVSRSARDEL